MIELGANRYGKSAIRLVRVDRSVEPHRVHDLTVDIALEGDFAAAHVEGDNELVIATDTMKNTVYAFAGGHLGEGIEPFGRVLAAHFLEEAQVAVSTVGIRAARWDRIGTHPDAFVRGGSVTRTATIRATSEGTTSEAGVTDLIVLKTTRSAFSGFPRDRYTTLPETDDRLMASKLSATWRYDDGVLDHEALYGEILGTLLEVFADHDSRSVQHSIWVMGRAMLDRHPELSQVRMVLPNLHHWKVDLSPFGLANDNEIFVATTEPHGLIEATVTRTDG